MYDFPIFKNFLKISIKFLHNFWIIYLRCLSNVTKISVTYITFFNYSKFFHFNFFFFDISLKLFVHSFSPFSFLQHYFLMLLQNFFKFSHLFPEILNEVPKMFPLNFNNFHSYNFCFLSEVSNNFSHVRCLAGRMAMHARQIGPNNTVPPCPGSPQQACVVTRGTALRQATFLPPFLHCYLSVRMVWLHSPFV